MTDKVNPHENAQKKAVRETEYSFLTTGRVSSVTAGQTEGQHHATVQESAAPTDQPVPVLPAVHGDYYVPPNDMPVLVAQTGKNNYNVISASIPKVDTPSIEPGERILSHPLSDATVKFNADGSLDVYSSNVVRINDGTQGIITDIETTTADGYVTSVTPVRDDNILI